MIKGKARFSCFVKMITDNITEIKNSLDTAFVFHAHRDIDY